MAQVTQRSIDLELKIESSGVEAFQKLRDYVADLAKAGGDAAPEFKALATELQRLEAQAKQLAVIDSLRADIEKAAQEQRQAADAAQSYRQALDETRAAVERSREAEREKKVAIAEAKAEIKAMEADLRSYQQQMLGASDKSDQYAATVRQKKAAIADAKVALAQLNAELTKQQVETAQAVTRLGEANRQYQDAARQVRAAESAVADLQRQLNTANTKLVEAGGASVKFSEAQDVLAKKLADAKQAVAAQVSALESKQKAEREAAAESQRLADIEAATKRRLADQAKAEAEGIIRDYNRMVEAQRSAAAESEQAARRMSDAFSTVGTKSVAELRAQIAEVRNAMSLLASSGQLTGRELEQAMAAGKARIAELERQIREATGSLTVMDKAAGLLNTTLGKLAAFVSVVEIVQRASRAFIDANMNLEKMRFALTSVYQTAEVAEQQIKFLQSTADKAGVSFNDISETFIKFSAAAKATNIPLEQSNALFAEVARVAGVLGLSADRVNRSLEALGQIASKGKVMMEELRQQLGDNFPGALALTAKGLGVTTAELIKMVEAGQVTAERFFPAFTKALQEIGGESTTLTAHWQRLTNAFARFFQELGKSGAIDALKSGLKGLTDIVNTLANNVDTLVSAGEALLKVWAATRFAGIIKGFFDWSNATKVATADTVTHTTKIVEQTAAAVANTQAITANTKAKLDNAVAARAAATAAAGLGTTLPTVAGGLGEVAKKAADAEKAKGLLATAAGVAGNALRGVSAALGGPVGLIALTAMYAKDLGELAAKLVLKARGMKTLEEAEAELAKQEEELKRKMDEAAAAAARKKAAADELRMAQYGLTAQNFKVIESFDQMVREGKRTDEALRQIGQGLNWETALDIQNAIRVLTALRDEGKITSEQMRAEFARALDGKDIADFEAKFKAGMLSNRVAAEQASEAWKAAIAAGTDPKAVVDFGARFAGVLGETAVQFQKAAQDWQAAQQRGLSTEELTRYQSAYESALEAVQTKVFGLRKQVERDSTVMNEVLDVALRKQVQNLGLDFEAVAGKVSQATTASIANIDSLAASVQRLRDQGVDVGRVLETAFQQAFNTAKSQADIDALRAKIELLRGVLGSQLTNTLLDQLEAKSREVARALDEARGGVNSVAEAMRVLGVTSQQSLNEAAARAREAFNVIRSSGTATSSELQQAFIAYANAAIAANGGVADSALQAQAAFYSVKIEVDETGRVIVKAMADAADATDNLARSADAALASLRAARETERALASSRAARKTEQTLRGDTGSDDTGKTWAQVDLGGIGGALQELRNLRADLAKVSLSLQAGETVSAATIVDLEERVKRAQDARAMILRFAGPGATLRTKDLEPIDTSVLAQARQTLLQKGQRNQDQSSPLSASQTTVNINVNGATTRVNVASPADAAALEQFLKAIYGSSTRALI